MLGMNKGATQDGKTSTNGQGPFTNRPNVIAASAPFLVQVNRANVPIPSRPTAQQTFLDTFDNSQASTFQQTYRSDTATDVFGNLGIMKYALGAGTAKAWEIEYRQANNIDSMPFISSDHFMDMLFDGATPGGSAPSHTLYGSMAMSPTKTFEINSGKIAHLTMEVDGHQTFRRWMDFQVAPASDPLQGWDSENHQVNNTNQALFLEFRDGFCTLDIFTGGTGKPTGTAGGSHGARLWGQSGSVGGAPVMCNSDEMYVKKMFSKNGLGLDDKSRYDLFLSQTHVALFIDGQLIQQSDIPPGTFGWSNQPLRGYFSHYLYHSDNDDDDLATFSLNGANMCYPLNSFFFNNPITGTSPGQTICNVSYPSGYGFPFSDERHWDNMGFEVFPASEAPANDFSNFLSVVQHPPLTVPSGSTTPPPAAPGNVRIIRTAASIASPESSATQFTAAAAAPEIEDMSHAGHAGHVPQGSTAKLAVSPTMQFKSLYVRDGQSSGLATPSRR